MFLSFQSSAQVDQQDSLTLVKINKVLIKEGWPSLWDTTGSVSSWKPITLSDGKVVSISADAGDYVDLQSHQTDSC